MKKIILIILSLSVLLSACTANAGVEIETGVDTELLPGDSSNSQSDQNQQPTSSGEWFRNPLVIGLLIGLGIALIVLVFMRTNRVR